MSSPFVYVREIDEFWGFNYQSLYEGTTATDRFLRFFATPVVPILAVCLYLLWSKLICGLLLNYFEIKPKGLLMQRLVIAHSAILAVYSGVTFVRTMQIYVPYNIEHGFWGSVCDVHGDLWYNKGLGFWITLFYLSKYYEFIDTWIILLKGREPIFLQTFHHAGIVILCWGFVATANTAGGSILTAFNSFIHTLMYTYYTFAAFGYSSPLKNYLTIAQMTQFGVGICLTIPLHFIEGCITPAQSLVIFVIQLYCATLIFLFYQFYKKTYTAAKSKDHKKVKADKAL